MIKRTLYFGNPAYLSVKLEQLEIRFPEVQQCANLLDSIKEESVTRVECKLSRTVTHALHTRKHEARTGFKVLKVTVCSL